MKLKGPTPYRRHPPGLAESQRYERRPKASGREYRSLPKIRGDVGVIDSSCTFADVREPVHGRNVESDCCGGYPESNVLEDCDCIVSYAPESIYGQGTMAIDHHCLQARCAKIRPSADSALQCSLILMWNSQDGYTPYIGRCIGNILA